CKLREEFLFEEDATNHSHNTTLTISNETVAGGEELCLPEDTAFYENLDNETISDFERLGRNARLGVYVEVCLLLGVVVNSAFLAVLLRETRRHLSTATILFVFNILFSNALYVASFVCLFSDLFDSSTTYGPSEELQHTTDAPLIIAESLNTHLFAQSEFLKHLAQETLFSLAQNGSLLGLTHLLILVLVVIHRSMAGKAIRLSQRCVICVFALVWFFLIVTHVIFSALQFSAITSLDSLFSKIATGGWQLRCEKSPLSDYTEVGERCDRVAVFHTFGVYLLRGHTLFTLVFLCASIVVFVVTLLYHWRIRAQHEFLNAACQEQQSPNSRRETLFNTLLLSLGAFFISVLGQSFVEIAVFWVDDRTGVAELATLYQTMRIASFADPLLNPILVSVRTPAMRRRVRLHHYHV
ncbi:Protein R07D5.2, partial [Aphelenchoides avenae]